LGVPLVRGTEPQPLARPCALELNLAEPLRHRME
jgi:hypothetical protein